MATPAIDRLVQLERGGADDLDDVMTVMEAAFGDTFGEAWSRSQCAGILPMAGVELTLARDPLTRRTCGFSLVRSVADESELLLIAVLPAQHRQGIGGRLLDQFIDRARHDGAARVHLEVRDGNPAISMYRDAGFRPAGKRRNYYHAPDGQRYDALTLVRQL
jgi:[ribosomal protein S18]-alanine N-acetyltransferase